MGVRGRGVRGAVAAALAVVALCAARAEAQEWHESYRAGVAALQRGDAARAVTALRRAVALRPEPGRNVQTYGTNIEPRYFPYLRLAEAHLAQGNLDGAREALRLSAVWGTREPAAERDALFSKLEAAAAARHPALSGTPTPEPAVVAPPPTTVAAVATPAPVSAPPTPGPAEAPRPDTPRPADRASVASPSAAPLPPASAPGGGTGPGVLEVVSQPPGASVYLDDELVGVSDPTGGRLVKSGVLPGRHRVRVARAGHDDALREVDVPPGGTALAAIALSPTAAPGGGVRGDFVAFAALVVLFLGGLVFLAVRKPAPPVRPIPTPTPAHGSITATGEPHTPSHLNPGAVRDEHGLEWFGEYQVLEMLGRGGMASVFRARRRTEVAALKRPLSALLDDQDLLERFLREAAIGRTLNHPNIVRILEQGYVGRVPYFTMELLAGETLQEVARRGPLPPRAAAALVVQIAEALDFAHGKGVVHRDLKPSNVMVLPGEQAKVMDFGIARAQRFDGMTATAAFLGTPDYVAPEMIEGRGTEARSDLYALGVVFFELLAGRLPFTGEAPFAVLRKHCTDAPAAPSSLRPGVPPALDALVLRLLAKTPDGRPTAEELVVALREWLNRAA
jgi:protein kinase-like protein/PEGA domain-containing protein